MSKSYQASIPTRRWNCLKLCAVSSIECMKAWWQVPRKAAPQPCKTLRDQHVLHFASKLLVKKHVATSIEGDSNAGLLTSMVLVADKLFLMQMWWCFTTTWMIPWNCHVSKSLGQLRTTSSDRLCNCGTTWQCASCIIGKALLYWDKNIRCLYTVMILWMGLLLRRSRSEGSFEQKCDNDEARL